MSSRTDLQTELETILGSENVYFQPPPSVMMKYPAIVYSLNRPATRHANNGLYYLKDSYEIVYIDKKEDIDMVHDLLKLPYCSYGRHYISDGMIHNTFTIYY